VKAWHILTLSLSLLICGLLISNALRNRGRFEIQSVSVHNDAAMIIMDTRTGTAWVARLADGQKINDTWREYKIPKETQ